MNAHLYIVSHRVEGQVYTSPIVGDFELQAHVTMAESFGAELEHIKDIEPELSRFVFDCYFEGALKEWERDCA